jgi:hypothetical protein
MEDAGGDSDQAIHITSCITVKMLHRSADVEYEPGIG